MTLSIRKTGTVLLASLILLAVATDSVSTATPSFPNPVLLFMGKEDYEANGKQWTRYK